MDLVLASNNEKKMRELDTLLSPLGVKLLRQGDLGISEAEEPFITFVENALTKARHASRFSKQPAIADDSGLSVQCLSGAPGIYSARYAQMAGGEKSDAANNVLLLQNMQEHTNRQARFVCALVAVRQFDDPEPLVSIGRWNGQIAQELSGERGFGYDPLFYLPEFQKTSAELTVEEKNLYSHRAQAMKQMLELMKAYWADLL